MIYKLLKSTGYILSIIILSNQLFFSEPVNGQPAKIYNLTIIAPNDTAVKIIYSDTLILPSYKEFEFYVKMRPACEIAAISLGIVFDPEYLQVNNVLLKDTEHGFIWNVVDNQLFLAWSDVKPILLDMNDTLLTITMQTLDISGLTGTLKAGLVESTEFADPSANIIQNVELEVPEIQYLKPDTIDTVSGYYARIYPNPFRTWTTLYFGLKEESKIRLSVVNADGMLIIDKGEMIYPEGDHQLRIDGLDFAKGTYFLKFEMTNSERREEEMFRVVSVR